MTARNDLQQAIVELRRRLGLTQQDLAVHLGKAVVTIARWETARPPRGESLAALVRMAEAAGHDDLAAAFACGLGVVSAPPGRSGAEGKADIAAAVRRLRLHLALTQEQLGQKLGVTGRVVRRWEAGVHRPGPKFTLRMSAMAGADSGGLADIFAAEAAEALGLSEEHVNVQASNPVRQLRKHVGESQQAFSNRWGFRWQRL